MEKAKKRWKIEIKLKSLSEDGMKKIIYIIVIGFCLFCLSGALYSHDPLEGKLDCKKCHACDNPSKDDFCLNSCPRLNIVDTIKDHKLQEAPDSFIIGEIANLFQPVVFNHKIHASMAEMGSNCATCHHYSPEDKIPPCKEYHGGEKNPNNLRQPSLKGAYHRQCMGCHREWSHDTKCIVCHLPSSDNIMSAEYDSTDILGISHPKISAPSKKVYHTSYEDGDIVTFYHSEHVERFDLKCVDCHQQENCSYCHELDKTAHVEKTEEEVHAVCNDCHKNDNCNKCHDTVEKLPFDHASTGWKLSKYHKHLECRNCHPTEKRITSMNANCNSCHAGWSQDNFRHEVTGLHLDEIHSEFDCEDCHIDLKYHNKPSCDNCHDDGKNYKIEPPGHR